MHVEADISGGSTLFMKKVHSHTQGIEKSLTTQLTMQGKNANGEPTVLIKSGNMEFPDQGSNVKAFPLSINETRRVISVAGLNELFRQHNISEA